MNRKLLVVDDEKDILNIMKKYFSTEGFEVVTAGSVAAALKKIGTSLFPVIITDMSFPGKHSGLDIVKAARERSRETEVIVITGYGSIKNAVDAMQLGAYDYITKPVDLNEMKIKVRRIFEMKEVERRMDDMHESIVAIEDSAGRNINNLESLLNGQEDLLRQLDVQVRLLKQQMPASASGYRTVTKIEKILAERRRIYGEKN
jgi:DNA-binding NtrC family response regulator